MYLFLYVVKVTEKGLYDEHYQGPYPPSIYIRDLYKLLLSPP